MRAPSPYGRSCQRWRRWWLSNVREKIVESFPTRGLANSCRNGPIMSFIGAVLRFIRGMFSDIVKAALNEHGTSVRECAKLCMRKDARPVLLLLLQSPVCKGGSLDIQTIIAQLETERDRLDQAISALQGSKRGPGRPMARIGRKGPRRLSAAARKKIAESAKRRWAKAKAAGKNSL